MFDGGGSLCALRYGRVGEDSLVMEKVALSVKTHYLATCAESRVNTHDALLSQRSRHKQLAQIVGKDVNGFLLSLFPAVCGKLVFDRWLQQTFVSVLNGLSI